MLQDTDKHEVNTQPGPPPVPAILYKYMTVETARIVLSTGKLRFQSPLRYNDPFDSQWDVNWPLYTPAARTLERSLIEQAFRDPRCWPANADKKFRQAMDDERDRISRLPTEQRELELAAFLRRYESGPTIPEREVRGFRDIRRRLRVLCLSEHDRSILMWSHYADQHCGVVLGFNLAACEGAWGKTKLWHLEAVRYKPNPPALVDPAAFFRASTFGTDEEFEIPGMKREWALTKHSDWAFEREWRLLGLAGPESLGDYDDIEFPRQALAEIVVGCKTDETRARELQSLAYPFRSDVRHFRMSMHPSRFELVKNEEQATTLLPSRQT